MAQADYIISNQTFPNTRADINNHLSAIATNNSGTSAPTTQYAGQFWIDTTSSTWTLYIHDGTDDIQFATIDTSANTVNFTDSALSVQTDPSPTLGGDLDTNGNNIDFGDGDRARFGAGNDLQIYHTGSKSLIYDSGAGDLEIRATNFLVADSDGTSLIYAQDNAEVNLYHNGSNKFQTTSSGINVTGTVVSDGLTVDTDTLYVDSTNNRVGVGTASPDDVLHIVSTDAITILQRTTDVGNNSTLSSSIFKNSDSTVSAITNFNKSGSTKNSGADGYEFRLTNFGNGYTSFFNDGSESMRIDSSGSVFINKTADSVSTDGFQFLGGSNNYLAVTRDGGNPLFLNRRTSDGSIIELRKDNSAKGSIGTFSSKTYIASIGNSGLKFRDDLNCIMPCNADGSNSDADQDLGQAGVRFKNLYLSGGVRLGGTGTANALDDYEEGTFTVTYVPATSGSVTLLGGENELSYVKVGNIVHVSGRIRVDSVSSPVGLGNIFSLPFAVAALTDKAEEGMGVAMFFGTTSSVSPVGSIRCDQNQVKIILEAYDGTSHNFDSNQVQALTGFRFSFTYRSV